MVPPPLPPLSLEKKKFTRRKEEEEGGRKKRKDVGRDARRKDTGVRQHRFTLKSVRMLATMHTQWKQPIKLHKRIMLGSACCAYAYLVGPLASGSGCSTVVDAACRRH